MDLPESIYRPDELPEWVQPYCAEENGRGYAE